ncbi:MAG: CCA tRNA nucleotidyltransferase, mitochondrial [Cyphobasidiales sp. Tagirdzhanova-0007]|nr:MAG: CCA tRNA nucleotidyltransferase, mitochondrial [Cyphobasidiales sp. Tagirdzhanova-0007]
MATSVPSIQLDPKEKQVLDLIDEFSKYLRETRRDQSDLECRVNGGWVRDKLLGLPCEDLDVCISSMPGHDFATLLGTYINEEHSKTSENAITSTKIAKIQANPHQSKHLETAKMHILGLEMDFVQLRSEEYAEGPNASRIPSSVRFGTPLEDALRRDITINALFYNVHSRKIEDWTEKGLLDLLSKSPSIRTPLDPLQTFLDDPLRILRCVRFASRFDFPLDASIKPAAEDERVKTALSTKVSRERIGVELDKMLKARDPIHALRLIDHLSLYTLVFSPVSSFIKLSSPIPPDASKQALLAGRILKYIIEEAHRRPGLSRIAIPIEDTLVRKRMWLAVTLSPLRKITYTEKQKTIPLSDTIIRDSVKLPGIERGFVQHIFAAQPKLSDPDPVKFLTSGRERERSSIGLLLRDGDVSDALNGLDWRTSVLFSLIIDLLPSWGQDEAAVDRTIQTYSAFALRVEELQLDRRAFEKSRLDGTEISTLLATQPGRLTAVLIQRAIEWQLDNPEGSKGECGTYLKTEWQAGNITIPDSREQTRNAKDVLDKSMNANKKRKESM